MAELIQLLPDAVANQIAAGEVIQRPASAVKELLENAIDAGAQQINLIIKNSGKTLIQLIDDGKGMSPIDARMSFERHATSKIQNVNDLFHITTKGFRGEALASIAAIAQVELQTKRDEDQVGTLLTIEGSKLLDQGICTCKKGSSIKVKNLFYNVPARRRFLKSDAVESKHIMEEFIRVALAHPDISFEYVEDGKQKMLLNPGNQKQRISKLIGNIKPDQLIEINLESGITNIRGYIGKPEVARKIKGNQYFFVNNRFIKHHYLNHAVYQAFSELIPDNMNPSYYIFFDIDPKLIDINIHPTKTEINFQDNKAIYAVLHAATKQALGKHNITPSLDFERETGFDFPYDANRDVQPPVIKINPEYNPFTKNPDNRDLQRIQSNTRNWEKLYQDIPKENDLWNNDQITDKNTDDLKTESVFVQVGLEYILTNIKSGIIIISQNEAHQRIIYDRLLKAQESKNPEIQKLLFPQSIQVHPSDIDLVSELIPDLHQIGFEVEKSDSNSFIITGAPSDIFESSADQLLEKIIDSYKDSFLKPKEISNQALVLSAAKNLAIKKGKALDVNEMKTIADQLFACQSPDLSPSGKPTYRIINTAEIGELFKV